MGGMTEAGRGSAAPAGPGGRQAPPRRGGTRALLSGVVALLAFVAATVAILALAVGRLGR
jgi:hypothetical protein